MRRPLLLLPLLSVLSLPCFCLAQDLSQTGEGASKILLADPRDYFASHARRSFQQTSIPDLPSKIWSDQKAIWTSPGKFRKSDLEWLLPLAATTGVLIANDHHLMTLVHANSADRNRGSLLSNAGLAAFGAATVASYALGYRNRNRHAWETGVLTTEAFADSYLVTAALKVLTGRQRPDTNGERGLFGQAAFLSSSFPSDHAALAWAAAAVFAREYPGPFTRWSAYGLASLISVSRIAAERHFPSDVLIGAAAGYLIGRYVYNRHHDDRLTDSTGATPVHVDSLVPHQTLDTIRRIRHSWQAKGSVYVPLDSWIYPALERLAAMGYVPDQVSGLKPWTRAECLRHAEAAADVAGARQLRSKRMALHEEALRLIGALQAELAGEPSTDTLFRVESIYTRFTGIGGKPLRDSYHFGQTLWNDYGRPYDQGFNNITGFSSYASAGPFFAYFRGEYQSAPGRAADPPGIRQFISGIDGNPLQGPNPKAAVNRFEPLEMYAGVRIGFENITFGKQSLWWGLGENSAFSFSNNAEPFYTLRFAQATPFILPGFLSRLGKIRTEFVIGKLSGHQWPARPFVNAQKITLDITDNFELGFTRSAFFGGVGHPLTLGNVVASFVSTVSKDYGGYGTPINPGDRHSGFDFRYRVPGLRRYVTVYSDSYADDDPNPIDNPRRSAWAPGLYLSQLPGLRHFDFRFETYSTWLYANDYGGHFIYWNNQYRDSYTNNGMLLGSWIGRDSRAYLASTTYWFSAKSKLQGQYRQIKAGNNFLPGGGTQTDFSMNAQWSLSPEWMISAAVQYERYYLPVLGGPERNVLGSLGIVFTPLHWKGSTH